MSQSRRRRNADLQGVSSNQRSLVAASRAAQSPICRYFKRGECFRGTDCWFRHLNVADNGPSFPAPLRAPVQRMKVGAARQSVQILGHVCVTLLDGFEVAHVETGFESPWVTLSNVSSSATKEQIVEFVKSCGSFVGIKFSSPSNQKKKIIQIKYQDMDRARVSCSKLSSSVFLGGRVIASLPISILKGRKVMLEDAVVRLEWQAPVRTAYAGYPCIERAHRAINAAMKEHAVTASLYDGLPILGEFNVKFTQLPESADDEFMKRLEEPEATMWDLPIYKNRQGAIDGIYHILKKTEGLLSFDVQPTVLPNGMLRGWAQFSSRTQAETAAERMHSRKPKCTEMTPIFAHYFPTIIFTLHLDTYNSVQAELTEFKNQIFHRHDGSGISFTFKEKAVIARITTGNTENLAQLKAEFESAIRGDTVLSGKEVVWDRYFCYPSGLEFIRNIEARVPGSRVVVNARRHCILLFGNYIARLRAKSMLVAKFGALRAQKTRIIPLGGRFKYVFRSSESAFKKLREEHGLDSICVDLQRKVICVRGSALLYETVLAAIQDSEAQTNCSHSYQRENNCLICLDTITLRVTLPCGHSFCRTCMADYLESAIEPRCFPLNCLGDSTLCNEPIPLNIARSILPANKFDALAEASLSNYVEARPGMFHYCPTPDCQQIYRSVSADSSYSTVLQCPSCLMEICPSCHVKYHEGFSCAEFAAHTVEFDNWKLKNGIKNCPGCSVAIEKIEGCNHMVCTRCHTHACWVCSKTFLKGEGIYAHMSQEHGGFGLEDVPLDPYVF